MAKKKKDRETADKVKAKALESAHKVWLAGLGALAVAEAEGGKLFANLVARGEAMEKRGKPVVQKLGKRAEEVREKAGEQAQKIGDEAKAAWTKVEDAVDDKVTAALHRMGIPTRGEIEALTKRVEELTAKVGAKSRKPAAKRARKPAAKRTRKAKAAPPA